MDGDVAARVPRIGPELARAGAWATDDPAGEIALREARLPLVGRSSGRPPP